MGGHPLIVLFISFLGFVTVLEACKQCPDGETAAFLPTQNRKAFSLTLKYPNKEFRETCKKGVGKTRINVKPGQFLEIRPVPHTKMFRALKLCVNVCRATSVQAWFAICRWTPTATFIPDFFTSTQNLDDLPNKCNRVCFELPTPDKNNPSFLDPNACGQFNLARIRLKFQTNKAWKEKIVVRCVKMDACLQNQCIQV